MNQFGNSPQDIYNQMVHAGQLEEELDEDYYSILAPIINLGYSWNPENHKLTDRRMKNVTFNTPWIHHKMAPYAECNLDHNVIFNAFGIIPKRCQECWKVCVSPRNYDELRKLEKIQVEMDMPSKCGIELRDYTAKHYGGYFYNSSLDEGFYCYDEVRKQMTKHFDEEMPVILKRACTEMELKKGCSLFWHLKPEDETLCQLVYHYVVTDDRYHDQSRMQRNHIRSTWALWAHSNGDMSYVPYNGGKTLFPKLFTYHNMDRIKIKDDLAAAKSLGVASIPMEATHEFRQIAKDYAESHNIDFKNLGHLLGHTEGNVLYTAPDELKGIIFGNTPEFVKGDADETT